jgi:NAD(P)-dependent dehydrogenase (short-subunit alcohol dehydrogenase family)
MSNEITKNKKVILITGGASGLGDVIVRRLAKDNHIIYCTSRKNVSSELKNVHFLKMDITSDKDVQRVIGEIMQREKQIDVVVNNAGITLAGPTLQFSADDFKKILDTNVIGSFRLIKEMSSLSLKPELIVNITSLNGFLSFPNFGIYSASKFAAEALGLALHYELSPATRVVNVAPGALVSEPSKKMSHKTAREKIPFLNWLMPLTFHKDVADVISDLIQSKTVPARVLIGRDAKIINMMQKVLPFSLFDRIVLYIWRKG